MYSIDKIYSINSIDKIIISRLKGERNYLNQKNWIKRPLFGKKRTFCKIDLYIVLYYVKLYADSKFVVHFDIWSHLMGVFWHESKKKKKLKKKFFFSKVLQLVTLAIWYYYSLGHSLLSKKNLTRPWLIRIKNYENEGIAVYKFRIFL